MSKFWELKQSAQPKTIDLYIYSEVIGDSYDWWTNQTIQSETSAKYFREALTDAGQIDYINIYINSIGGSVIEGNAIYSQLKRHPAQKTVYIDGYACSVASLIAMAGDKVIMPRNTAMFIHNMSDYCFGNSSAMRKKADDLDTLMEADRQAYLQKTGDKLSEDELIKMLDAETWLTAEQCIEYGLADEYAEKEADLTEAKAMLEKQNQVTQKAKIASLKIPDEILNKINDEQDPEKGIEPKPEQTNEAAVKLMAAFINSLK